LIDTSAWRALTWKGTLKAKSYTLWIGTWDKGTEAPYDLNIYVKKSTGKVTMKAL
jgi:hypothetical protein